MAVVEDDYDQEFHYDGRPLVPMAASDAGGNVIYVGTLAKILAPGLRLGFVVAPPALLARMAAERALVDVQGDAVLECAVADLLEDGEIQRHVRRVRRVYHQRRDAVCAAFDANFSGVLTYARPPGGLALWARVAKDVDLAAWHARCRERGVFFQEGGLFTFDRRAIPFARFGYAALDERSLALAVRVMRESLARRRGGAQPRPRPSRSP
jgi:GntR family transcriptional regulator/MocR family aminotransferase